MAFPQPQAICGLGGLGKTQGDHLITYWLSRTFDRDEFGGLPSGRIYGYTEANRPNPSARLKILRDKEFPMTRPTHPTLLPDASCLHLVRLEAEEQSFSPGCHNRLRSSLSALPVPFGERAFALRSLRSRFALGRLGSAAGIACATLFLPE